jgi:hypothetical protein
MTLPRLNAVGFCAHYSLEGDWAFDYALSLSRLHAIRLNVFHFLTDPYDPADEGPAFRSKAQRTKLIVERERELRMYYDSRAGDYLEVGFRLCADNEWTELHRCLLIREFQVLVLGYVGRDATFAGKPIEEFADSFICPVILVGPDSPQQFHLNRPAALYPKRFGLPRHKWHPITSLAG